MNRLVVLADVRERLSARRTGRPLVPAKTQLRVTPTPDRRHGDRVVGQAGRQPDPLDLFLTDVMWMKQLCTDLIANHAALRKLMKG